MEELYDKVLEEWQDEEDKFKYRIMDYHYKMLRNLYIRGKINKFDLKRLSAQFCDFIIREMSRKD